MFKMSRTKKNYCEEIRKETLNLSFLIVYQVNIEFI